MSTAPDSNTSTGDYLAQCPGNELGCYVNHAAISPWPRCTSEAVQSFAAENHQRGPASYKNWMARETNLRRQLAMLLNAESPDDIALLKNTTEGISTVAFGLDFKAGDNIVIPRDEFPSNCLPWLAQAKRGVEIRQVDIRQSENAETALQQAMDDRTRLLAVSAVQWTDGFRLDLRKLGHWCRQNDVLFFVDAIQQLGALQLDVQQCHIDFLAADAHKWLMGPEGIAVFYSHPSSRLQLELLQLGWHMADSPWTFSSEARPSTTARRFEAGSPNSLGQVAMQASLDWLMSIGMPTVEQRVLSNTALLMKGMEESSGLKLISRPEAERRSGIVSFVPESGTTEVVYQQLLARKVHCALRNGVIRLSPHFYQGEKEITRLLEYIVESV